MIPDYLPQNAKLVYSESEIIPRVKGLGEQLTPWAEEVLKRTGEQLLAICVLRGGVFFFADLLRRIAVSIEPAFCRAWSYSSASNQQMGKGVQVSAQNVEVQGRTVLLVDDICDSGATLRKLNTLFSELGAREIRTVVLIRRLVENPEFVPELSAFTYQGAEWFVGYGMEDKNRYSNLTSIYSIENTTVVR